MSEAVDPGHAARRLAARGASSVALSRLGNVVDIVSQPIYTWMFGLATYGLYQVLWSLVNLSENIFDLGVTSGLQRILPREEEKGARAEVVRAALVLGIGLPLVVALGASLAAPWLAPLFNAAPKDVPRVELAIRLFAWALPLWATVEVATSAVRACHAFGPEVRLRLMWEQSARLVAALVFWAMGLSVLGLLLAHLCSLTITAVAALRLLNRYVALRDIVRVRTRRELVSDMFWSGLSVLPSNILGRVFSDVATVVANLLAPGAAGASAAGLYAIARKVASLPQIVRQTFSYVLGPIAAAATRGDRSTLQGLYDFAVRLSLLMALPTCAALIAAGPAILGLFAKGAENGWPIMAILAASRGIEAAVGPASAIQQVIGKKMLPVFNSLIAFVVSGLVVAITAGPMPHLAVAWGVGVGQVLVAALSIGQLKRDEGLRAFEPPFPRVLAIALAICGAIALVGLAAGQVSLKLQGGAVVIAWAALVWLGARKGLTPSDKAALGKAAWKLRLI